MRSRTIFVSASIGIVVVCMSVVAQAQRCDKPITHLDFLSAIQKGKREKKSAADYIELVKSEGVNFALTSHDVQTLRRRGNYLGQKGLDDLQKAVREYRCKVKGDSPSIAIINSPGAIVNSPGAASNVAVLAARRIPIEAQPRIIEMLSKAKGKVVVYAPVNNNEASQIALDIHDVLARAGWDMQGEPVRYYISVGPSQPGILIKCAGEPVPPGAPIMVSNDEPVGVLGRLLVELKLEPTAQRYKDMAVGVIHIEVGPHP